MGDGRCGKGDNADVRIVGDLPQGDEDVVGKAQSLQLWLDQVGIAASDESYGQFRQAKAQLVGLARIVEGGQPFVAQGAQDIEGAARADAGGASDGGHALRSVGVGQVAKYLNGVHYRADIFAAGAFGCGVLGHFSSFHSVL